MRLGIDIGGTNIRVGLFGEDGTSTARGRIPVAGETDAAVVLRAAAREAECVCEAAGIRLRDISRCGIGVPGSVVDGGRSVLYAPNLDWYDVPVAAMFESLTGLAPRVMQDSRAAAWAEYRFGAGRGSGMLICITLGTGVGCGIVAGGRVLEGAHGVAGEFGHLPIVADGRECPCGSRGCTERYCSGTGLLLTAKETPELADVPSAEALFARAEAGDSAALSVLNEGAALLGRALAGAVNLLGADTLLFSGGMCAQTKLYVEPAIEAMRRHLYHAIRERPLHVGVAALGAEAPMIGAAFYGD